MTYQADSIVITGIGAVSAFGLGADAVWAALENGETPRALLEGEATSSPQTPYGVKVGNWNPVELLGKRGLQFLRPSTQFLLGASQLALAEAGLKEQMPDPDDLGVVIGTNLAGLQSITNYDFTAVTEGPQYVSPMEAPNTLANAPASHLAIRVQARALNTTIASGQCAGFDALGYASKMLREGRARYVLVGGVEELNERVLWMYQNSNVLPHERPEDAGRPFDGKSTGWVPGEGAAVLVLERYEDAVNRGAKPLAELVSWAASFSAPSSVEKRAKGLTRAAKNALQIANLSAEEIDLVVSGANGHHEQDRAEAMAITELFGEQRPDIDVCAIKGTLGESYGASGLFQAVAAVGALQRGTVPATAGYESEDSEAPHLPGLRAESRSFAGNHVLLTGQDLFGSASAVVLRGAGA